MIHQIYAHLSSLESLLHNQFNNLKGLTYIRYYDFVIYLRYATSGVK